MAVRAARLRVFLLAGLAALPAGLAGCSTPNFLVDVGAWRAGYAWEYDEKRHYSTHVSGTVPAFLQEDLQPREGEENRTHRLEVFNSTAYSVEGLPIYGMAVLSRLLPDENQSVVQTDFWDAEVYTADLNRAVPVYLDWESGEVQLSNDEPTEEDNATTQGNGTRPAEENRLLDWPLTRGHRWVNEEDVPGMEGEPGLLQGSALREATVRVPAGSFRAVRMRAIQEPFDTSQIEAEIRQDLASDGGVVKRVVFRHVVTHEYAYSAEALNLVEHRVVTETTLSARGRDGEGDDYDFTFRERADVRRQLLRFQVVPGAEKPLSFAIDIRQGIYLPKPIIPAAHFAVEIVGNRDAVNFYAAEGVRFGVRIYNSSAGELPLRGREREFPAVASPDGEYDHHLLEIKWSLRTQDLAGRFIEFRSAVGDSVDLAGSEFTQSGLKQIKATLKLKDTEKGPGQEIFTDSVYFEAFYHANLTFTRQATNVTPTQGISVRFPVETSWSRVRVNASLQNAPPEAQCPVSGSSDCLRVSDGANQNVQDARAERMRFEVASRSGISVGLWRAEYTPSAPGQSVMFEVVVRYAPPA